MPKTNIFPLLPALLFLPGCLVRSLNPWLPPETILKNEQRLVGTWHDKKDRATMFLDQPSDTEYRMVFVTRRNKNNGERPPVATLDKYEVAEFTATVHDLEGALLLAVGPKRQEGEGRWTTSPAYLLFKLELEGKSMRAFTLSVKGVSEFFKGSGIKQQGHQGLILTQPTEELTRFLRQGLKKPELWEPKPRYEFERIGEGAGVKDKSSDPKGKGGKDLEKND